MKNFKLLTKTAIVGYILLCVVLIITIHNNNKLKMSNSRLHQMKDMQFELIYKLDNKLDSCGCK